MLPGIVPILFAPEVRLEVREFESRILAGNPLHDPTKRKVAVFASTSEGKAPRRILLYLPGFGGSSEDAINGPQSWKDLVAKWGLAGDSIVLVVPDGRNRFGCSQYINSPASGRYLDYLCDEVVPRIEREFHCGGSPDRRIVAGHSSGGFGALRLGLARTKQWGHVLALSPDSYFDVTHLPLARDPSCAKVKPAAVQALQRPGFAAFSGFEGEAPYCIALSCDYAGNPDGSFEWLYDQKGAFRDEVYARWTANDPLTIVKRRGSRSFADATRVYLEGPSQDDFRANIGAHAIFDALKGRARTVFYEPPGHHSDHLMERIDRAVNWTLGRQTTEIH